MRSRFRTVRVLGHGGMSTVYLAHDAEVGRDVALKVLASNLADDDVFKARFLREGQLAARVSHPNIVEVYAVGEDERGPFIVMEYVDGGTLAAELASHGRFAAEKAVTVAAGVSSALAEAHNSGVVHRDVTPRNVLLGVGGLPKLSDFGIARPLDGTRLTEVGTIMGTAGYLAPEQARGEVVTPAADVYSLGAVLYELLTGRPPFDADTVPGLLLQSASGRVVAPSKLVSGISRALEDTVLRMLATAPENRPSAAALAETLPGSLGGDDGKTRVLSANAATQVLLRASPRRSSARRPVLAVAAMSAAALLAFGVARATDSGSPGPSLPPVHHASVLGPVAAPPPPSPPPLPALRTPPPATLHRPHHEQHGKGKKKGHEKHGRRERDD
jgi:serine/threonine protein kinase